MNVVDPATGEGIGSIPVAAIADAEEAIEAAARALAIWRSTPAWTRAGLLHHVADVMHDQTEEAARTITLESGKPLAQSRRVEAMQSIVADAERRGGKIETGGHRPQIESNGFFFSPTVISGLPDDAMALAEENFGPIAAITPFSDIEEVYRRANASEFGLAAYVFTRDPARMREAVSRIESGMVAVNSFALAAAEAPFGGIKTSGMGREGGAEGILDFLNVKLSHVAV